ncbi:HEPN domain-containing protein [Nevskia soli]|uniref:HEPN domain-containing protein n=1 Tax=Nevskia soli TaxID=418856 RepID=UPI0015D889B5|nr:HEPN domain-containing protein [Nevskia soli]
MAWDVEVTNEFKAWRNLVVSQCCEYLLLLRKAAQGEALLDTVLESPNVSDEVIRFHCQQAAEKMLKAALYDLGATFHKTHELGEFGPPHALRRGVSVRRLGRHLVAEPA